MRIRIRSGSGIVVVGSVLVTLAIGTFVVAKGAVRASAAGDPAAGKTVFTSNGCGGCHTLADAGAKGKSGPNLDATKPGFDKIVDAVTNGKGAMPGYKSSLSGQQIQDVAAYIVDAVNKAPGGGGGGTGGGADKSRTVSVTLKGWKMKLSPTEVPAGVVTFEVRNRDKRPHQFLVLGSSLDPHTLKVKRGRASESGRVGKKIRKIVPRHTRHLYRNLKPGKYILIDNLRGHYKKGMFAALRVVEPAKSGGGSPPSGSPPLSAGAQAFLDAGCGGCHTLADAGATGTIASNLDTGKPSLDTVKDVVTNGIKHTMQSASVAPVEAMPAFNTTNGDASTLLSTEQIQDMASYVSGATGGGDGSSQPAGRQAVLSTGCATCHSLADVGGTASDPGGEESYSNLDIAKASRATVETMLEIGHRDMPKYLGPRGPLPLSQNARVLDDTEISEVADYVSTATGGSSEPPGPLTDDKQIYLIKGCSSCHSLDDAGGVGERASKFDIGKPTYDTVMRILNDNYGTGTNSRWGLTPGMPSRRTYSDPEQEAISRYISTVTGGGDPDPPATGRQLSLVGGCGNCHVIADTNGMAKGGSVGPNLDNSKPGALTVELILNSGLGPQPPTNTTVGMPRYLNDGIALPAVSPLGPDSNTKFSAAEVTAVSNFIHDVTAAAP